ncbi:MAG: hypothetical protein OXE99_10390, partial [Cellvibrionales bacterium]|nr:hypothetical protein [Cellvibrionales bacterium]
KSSLLLLLLPPLLFINNCLFIMIQLVPLYFDDGWYFHSLSNLSGSLLSLLLVISIVLEVKKGLIRDK